MKKYMITALFLSLNMILIPLITYAAFPQRTDSTKNEEKTDLSQISFDSISVYNAETNEALTMDFRDYIIGVVAAEMPAQFHEEALSACAAAAATLARKKIVDGEQKELSGAVISTDPKKHQAFSTNEMLKEKWGGDYSLYYEKICKAVDKAIDYSITYEGELIVAAYHAMSSGVTEDAKNVWEGGFPYLVSVESTGDKLSPKYETEVKYSFEDFRDIFIALGASFPEDKTLWFSEGEYTKAGTLMNIKIGGKDFSGEKLRDLLSLRSSAISLSMNNEGITVNVRGYGHGVGMSQYGADYLARQGYSWQEIIKHYYTGVNIEII